MLSAPAAPVCCSGSPAKRVRGVPGPACWQEGSGELLTKGSSLFLPPCEMGWWLTEGTERCQKGVGQRGRQWGAVCAPGSPRPCALAGTAPFPQVEQSDRGQVPLPWPAGVLPCSHPAPGRAVGIGLSTPALPVAAGTSLGACSKLAPALKSLKCCTVLSRRSSL